MTTWGSRRRWPTPGWDSRNWSPRSRWAVSASCWASRCPGWRAPAATGSSCFQLCSLAGTLLADPDGVYDPGADNDRLLGLTGTMSEAELYLIRQRMLSGKLAKAERGELGFGLPIGYVRRPSGEV